MDKVFLNAKEAAEMLSFSRQNIYKLVEKGELPFYKIGAAVRFKKDELLNYIAKKRVPTNDELLQ